MASETNGCTWGAEQRVPFNELSFFDKPLTFVIVSYLVFESAMMFSSANFIAGQVSNKHLNAALWWPTNLVPVSFGSW